MSKYDRLVWNMVAKRIRDKFTDTVEGEGHQNTVRKLYRSGVLAELAIDFAKGFKRDNPNFDPIKWLDQCSPDPDTYMLSELWEYS